MFQNTQKLTFVTFIFILISALTNLDSLTFSSPATMVWLVNMADTDRPKRNSTEATPPQQQAQEGERGVFKRLGRVIEWGLFWWLPFRTARLLFSLTVITRLQPCRLRLPPVCRRTTGASPPTGSTSSSTSWGPSSPPSRPEGRSRRCRPLGLLLKTTMKRVSADRRIYSLQLEYFYRFHVMTEEDLLDRLNPLRWSDFNRSGRLLS